MLLSQFIESGAIFSLNKETLLVGYGKCRWTTRAKLDHTKPAYYLPDFFLVNEAPWLQFDECSETSPENLINELQSNISNCSQKLEWNNPYQQQFNKEFASLQNLIHQSILQKAVPYVFSSSESKMDQDRLKQCLLNALNSFLKHPGHLYGLWDQSHGMLGITPELLFRSEKGILETMALAGTCAKEKQIQSFMQNPKEIKEHHFVIEGIKASLGPYGKVEIGDMQVMELAHLNHLYTPIKVQLNNHVNYERLVKVLHPTPALGAFPRLQGERWLKVYDQKIPRGRFGAPAAIYIPTLDLFHCVVAIRNVHWNADGMKLGAGCGVIKESQVDKEWAEINLKIGAIRGNLGL